MIWVEMEGISNLVKNKRKNFEMLFYFTSLWIKITIWNFIKLEIFV